MWFNKRSENLQSSKAERCADDWLWRHVESGRSGQEPGDSAAEMTALTEVSDAVRAACRDDESGLTHAAQDAFISVHRRLMDAIEFSSVDIGAPPRRAGRMGRSPSWAIAMPLFIVVAWGGHQLGWARASTSTPELPVKALVDDFDAGLHSPNPFEYVTDKSGDSQAAARWLSQRAGTKITLPSPGHAGVKLVGARHHIVGDRSVAQTRYVKDGVPLALYQLREPKCGLGNMDEVGVRGRIYLTSQQGQYHVVAWRSGEMVMTLVSPLESSKALELAAALRDDAEPTI